MVKLSNLSLVRWAKAYSWDVRFIGGGGAGLLPPPFDSWFPAQSVEETIASLESFSFVTGHMQNKIPKSRTPLDLRITFMDDVDCTLEQFFTNWMKNVIFVGEDKEQTVNYVNSSVDVIMIQRLDNQRKVTLSRSYYVYPEGPLVFNGSEESAVRSFSLSFVIAGVASDSSNAVYVDSANL